jgi:hypothetical protein
VLLLLLLLKHHLTMHFGSLSNDSAWQFFIVKEIGRPARLLVNFSHRVVDSRYSRLGTRFGAANHYIPGAVMTLSRT